MGILMEARGGLEGYFQDQSQSPKAGHGYSDFQDQQPPQKWVRSLNPLKRVMGNLILVIAQIEAWVDDKSQSPKAGHGYSDSVIWAVQTSN